MLKTFDWYNFKYLRNFHLWQCNWDPRYETSFIHSFRNPLNLNFLFTNPWDIKFLLTSQLWHFSLGIGSSMLIYNPHHFRQYNRIISRTMIVRWSRAKFDKRTVVSGRHLHCSIILMLIIIHWKNNGTCWEHRKYRRAPCVLWTQRGNCSNVIRSSSFGSSNLMLYSWNYSRMIELQNNLRA